MDGSGNTVGYWLRHRDGQRLKDGNFAYNEDFLIAHGHPSADVPALLHCAAYGEGFWRKGYQQSITLISYWSFEMLVDGNAVFTCGGRRYKLKAGDAYILRPGRRITLRPDDAGFLRKRCALIESPILNGICGSGRLGEADFMHATDPHRLEGIYDALKCAILAGGPFLHESVGVQCYALLAELSRMAAACRHPTALQMALNLIDSRLQDEFSLDSLCDKCDVSARTLSRLFMKHMGVSPIKYVINRRLTEAKTLVQLGMSLKEIAGHCGYKSESFLSRAFKRKFGKSPRAFKNSMSQT